MWYKKRGCFIAKGSLQKGSFIHFWYWRIQKEGKHGALVENDCNEKTNKPVRSIMPCFAITRSWALQAFSCCLMPLVSFVILGMNCDVQLMPPLLCPGQYSSTVAWKGSWASKKSQQVEWRMNTVVHVFQIVIGPLWGLFHSEANVCVNASIVCAHSKHDLQMEKLQLATSGVILYLKGFLETGRKTEQGNLTVILDERM